MKDIPDYKTSKELSIISDDVWNYINNKGLSIAEVTMVISMLDGINIQSYMLYVLKELGIEEVGEDNVRALITKLKRQI